MMSEHEGNSTPAWRRMAGVAKTTQRKFLADGKRRDAEFCLGKNEQSVLEVNEAIEVRGRYLAPAHPVK